MRFIKQVRYNSMSSHRFFLFFFFPKSECLSHDLYIYMRKRNKKHSIDSKPGDVECSGNGVGTKNIKMRLES